MFPLSDGAELYRFQCLWHVFFEGAEGEIAVFPKVFFDSRAVQLMYILFFRAVFVWQLCQSPS